MNKLDTFLAEAEARCKKATPGPWRSMECVEENPVYGFKVVGAGYSILTADTRDGDADQHDCEFAAHARRDLPTALSLLAAFAAVVEEARVIDSELDYRERTGNCDNYTDQQRSWDRQDKAVKRLRKLLPAADAAVAAHCHGPDNQVKED